MMPFQAMRLRNGVLVPAPLLDLYPGAVAAYSVARKLKTGGSTYGVRIRRSSDTGTMDIGFSGNDIDISTMSSFVGASNGDLLRVYNQANGADYLDNAGSPRIIAAGVLNTLGSAGRPCVTLGGSDYFTSSGSVPNFGTTMGLSGNLTFSVFGVYRKTTGANGAFYGWGSSLVALQACGFYDDGTNPPQVGYAGLNGYVTTSVANNTQFLYSATKTPGAINTTSTVHRNGSSVASGSGHSTSTPNVSGSNALEWGRFSGSGGGKLLGQIQELIIYPSDQSANRAAITANINAYYGIY